MSFTTPAKVKLMLGKDTLSAMETAQIEMLISLIDGVINSYCGWTLLATDYTAKAYDGRGTDTLDLGVYPINSVTTVYDVTQDLDITTAVTPNNTEGTLKYPLSSGTFSTGSENIQVTMNAGFADDAIPNELVYAANYLVVINFNRIKEGTIGVASEKFNDIAATYDSEDIPKLVKRVLDRYRKVAIF